MTSPPNLPSHEALRLLQQGNHRWVSDLRCVATLASASRREALAGGQSPFAIVLSCSDSRVPAEMIFDQGLGSLFVVRVAGNVVAPSLVGSIEFAVQSFGVGLVVVMGHTSCGAVRATLDAIASGHAGGASENVLDIVRRIRPAVEALVGADDQDPDLLMRATRANVVASAEQLRVEAGLLSERVAAGRLLVVGAEYSLTTGVVDFFDVPRRTDDQVTTTTTS